MTDPRPDTEHVWQDTHLFDNCECIPYDQLSHREWEDLRWAVGGIGGSEIGGICGVVNAKYFDINGLLLDKIGFVRKSFTPNTLTEWGHATEPITAHWYEHYQDGDKDNKAADLMLLNLRNGQPVAKVQDMKMMFRNRDYPILIGNPDRVILRHRSRPDMGVLEMKSTSSQYAQQHLGDIPPQHIFQGQGYCMIMDLDYFEIVQVMDNCRQFHVTLFERRQDLESLIFDRCMEFWDRVIEGRQRYLNANNEAQAWAGLSELLYDSASDDYARFLTDKQQERDDLAEVDGIDEVVKICLEYYAAEKKSTRYAKTMAIARNRLRKYFHDSGVRKMAWQEGPLKSVSFHKKLIVTTRKEDEFWNQ